MSVFSKIASVASVFPVCLAYDTQMPTDGATAAVAPAVQITPFQKTAAENAKLIDDADDNEALYNLLKNADGFEYHKSNGDPTDFSNLKFRPYLVDDGFHYIYDSETGTPYATVPSDEFMRCRNIHLSNLKQQQNRTEDMWKGWQEHSENLAEHMWKFCQAQEGFRDMDADSDPTEYKNLVFVYPTEEAREQGVTDMGLLDRESGKVHAIVPYDVYRACQNGEDEDFEDYKMDLYNLLKGQDSFRDLNGESEPIDYSNLEFRREDVTGAGSNGGGWISTVVVRDSQTGEEYANVPKEVFDDCNNQILYSMIDCENVKMNDRFVENDPHGSEDPSNEGLGWVLFFGVVLLVAILVFLFMTTQSKP